MTTPDADLITLTLEIENSYELYDDFITVVNVQVPPPPASGTYEGDAARDTWEYDHIFDQTGSRDGVDRTRGDSWYDVTVVASSHPHLIPVGTMWDFGY